eukprot:gene8893-843_t
MKRKLECDECGKSYTAERMKKHKKKSHKEEIYKKPEKRIEFIPEILNEIVSFLPAENKIYINFMNVSKQFYQVFMDSNYSKAFIVQKLFDENFQQIHKDSQLSILEQTKKRVELLEKKLRLIDKKNELNSKWMQKYNKPKKSKSNIQPYFPYSEESKSKIRDIPNHIEIISYSKNKIESFAGEENCHVILYDLDLFFRSRYTDYQPNEASWYVRDASQTDLIFFLMNWNEDYIHHISVSSIKQKLNLGLSDKEISNLLNDLAEILVNFPHANYSVVVN